METVDCCSTARQRVPLMDCRSNLSGLVEVQQLSKVTSALARLPIAVEHSDYSTGEG